MTEVNGTQKTKADSKPATPCKDCEDFKQHLTEELSFLNGIENGIYTCQKCGRAHLPLTRKDEK